MSRVEIRKPLSVHESEIECNQASPEVNECDVVRCDRENVLLKVRVCVQEEQAKLEEIQKLKDFDSYEAVEDKGQTSISTMWVITTKGDGKKNARLVARGFEESVEVQSDSPTVSKSLI